MLVCLATTTVNSVVLSPVYWNASNPL